MRYDLTFFLCCCKSFLGSDPTGDEENFYTLLGVERDATHEEIKKAYKRKSLRMHPDKIAQSGKAVTAEDQARFTRMKEAYEILSDTHKRETYDAIGERGMKWLEEPFSLDPQELAHNFARSSVLDRSKIFAIFVAIAVAVLLLPIMICLQVDGTFGRNAKWAAILFPLWIWNAIIVFYHTRVIMMGPIARPDHIPPEEWVDPLPMRKRIFSMVRFLFIVLFEILLALKLDDTVPWSWFYVFIPLYAWEATTLYKKLPLARMRIVTVQDLEVALGKPYAEFTAAEKELIGKRYSVVPSTDSPEFEAAQKLKLRARHDMIKSVFRIAFVMLLLIQLDGNAKWSWWLIFSPFWLMTALFCYSNYQAYSEVLAMAAEKDPVAFGKPTVDKQQPYNSADGTTTNTSAVPPLSDEEREELRAQVMASNSRLCSKCSSQGFLALLMILFVAKIQGAGWSAIWIMTPVLLIVGMILFCIGFAIFGITEVPTDGVEFDTGAEDDIEATPISGGERTTYVPPTTNSTTATNNSTTTTTTTTTNNNNNNNNNNSSSNSATTAKSAASPAPQHIPVTTTTTTAPVPSTPVTSPEASTPTEPTTSAAPATTAPAVDLLDAPNPPAVPGPTMSELD